MMMGACCAKSDDSVTQLRLSDDGHTVGIMGLGAVFEQLWAMGRKPDEATDQELVGMARQGELSTDSGNGLNGLRPARLSGHPFNPFKKSVDSSSRLTAVSRLKWIPFNRNGVYLLPCL